MSKFDWYEESVKEERRAKSFTIEKLAFTIHDQLSRCDIPRERIHTYAVEDSVISFVILPGQLLISVTKSDQSDRSGRDESESEPSQSESEPSQSESESSTPSDHSDHSESESDSSEPENEPADETEQEQSKHSEHSKHSDEWTKVKQKNKGTNKSTSGQKHYELFRDPANVPFMDYDGCTTKFSELKEFAQKHSGCHAYCPEKNIVFDFSDEKNPCRYRIFTPNQQYQTKYQQWTTERTAEQNTERAVNESTYTLFRDHFNYNTITGKKEPPEEFGQKLTLSEVRATIKQLKLDYAHAYATNQKEIINFTRHGFKLMQRIVAP